MNDQDKYLEFDVLIDNVASNVVEEDKNSLKENTQRLKDMYYQSLLLNQKQQKIINQLADTSARLNEYLQTKKTDGWGENVADVAIKMIEEQQKEIELTKSTWYENYCQQRDMTMRVRDENAQLREALNEILYSDECMNGDILKRMYAMQDKARQALEGEE